MKKTYWWRILAIILSGGMVTFGWIYDTYLCFSSHNSGCLFDQYREAIIEPIVLLSIFLFIISIFLFFINDKVFLKWLRFATVWIILSAILIAITPAYSGGWIAFGPDKETVSIWMGSLFVILSLAKIIWDSMKQKSDRGV